MTGVTLAVSGVAAIVIFGPSSAQALDALSTLLLLHTSEKCYWAGGCLAQMLLASSRHSASLSTS